MRTFRALFAVLLIWTASAAPAQAPTTPTAPAAAPASATTQPARVGAQSSGMELSIRDGNASQTPIAVIPFAWQSAGITKTDVAQVIRSDLNRSGRFNALRDDRIPEFPARGADVKFGTWRLLNQKYLLIGAITDGENGLLRIEFELFSVVDQKSILHEALLGRIDDLRSAAHQIADKVYEKIYSQRGAFWTRIAYITSSGLGDNRKYQLIVADSDGFNQIAIVNSATPLLSPAWSPDSKRLAYVSFERGNSAIYIQEITTGARRLIASFKGINGSPAFSPDGSRLALTLSRTGNPEIYVMDLASNALTQLTKSFAIDTEPVWMPNGREILFTSDRGGRPQVYAMSDTGQNVRRITFEGTENAKATVSADGKRIATAQGFNSLYRVAMIDRERGEPGIVTQISTGRLDESPSFAPNGSMILYAAREGAKGVLYSVSSNGLVRQKLDIPLGDVREPAWSSFRQR
jgi:TolB protein